MARTDTDREAEMLSPPNGYFLVMANGPTVVGCGGVQRISPRTAEIKRMWIKREWRRGGLGARLLSELEARALDLACSTVVLDINEALHEAQAMYTTAGYTPIEPYNDNPYAHHWFGKQLH